MAIDAQYVKLCPFCGVPFKPTYAPNGAGAKKVVGYAHPRGDAEDNDWCYMAGHHVGSEMMKRFDKRVENVHYTVDSGLPVFNTVGIGTPCTAHMLNTFFAYVKQYLPRSGG